MVNELIDTAGRLWRTAPPWRYTVIAAAAFTLFSIAWALQGGGPSEPESTALAPRSVPVAPDPASDMRLADYDAVYEAAMKIPAAGERCEHLVAAYGRLTDEDRARGRNVRIASRARLAALSAGERCRSDLAASDRHFAGFEVAIAAAETNRSPETVKAAAEADTRLDAFDRSRARYGSEATLLAKGKGFADLMAASDAHIAALTAATDAFAADHSPPSYLRVAEAVKQLTDFDRSRLTPTQSAALDTANQALTTLNESRTRLAKLRPLVADAENGRAAQIAVPLLTATAAITPFDEAVATPEQKETLAKARTAAKPLAWALLQERVNALAAGETPEADQAAASVYQLVKDIPQGELTGAQQALLAKGRAAADALYASDDRLGALLAAAERWQQRNGTIDRSVLSAMQAITPFDRKRFQDRHRAAWETLARAEAIIRGPELGLTAETKTRVPIFVFSSRQGAFDGKVADAVRASLRREGFQIVSSSNDAALLTDVYVDSLEEPAIDTSGVVAMWKTTAQLHVNAVWAADDSSLLASPVQAVVTTQDREDAKIQALRAGVSDIAKMFERLTRK